MASRRRLVVAVLFSLVVPGAGHAYLRAWIRAIAWFSIAVATVALVLPETAQTGLQSGSFEAVFQQALAVPDRVHYAVLVVSVLSAIDAAVLVVRRQRQQLAAANAGSQCPHCGGELDDELDFCPWCTTRLESDAEGRPVESES